MKTTCISLILFLLLFISAFTDIKKKKIYNFITLPAIGLGLILNFAFAGFQGLINSMWGLGIGFGFFFILYLTGGMGGGDVKLMAAIGSIMGYPFIVDSLFFSILIGGFVAILVTLWKKTFLNSLKNILRTILTFLLPNYHNIPLKKEDSHKIPFGFCIAVGTAIAWICTNYFYFSCFRFYEF